MEFWVTLQLFFLQLPVYWKSLETIDIELSMTFGYIGVAIL